ncbi:GPW/gp25 family protein [Methylosinus sp. Sm6]|uniref:GPW/gp25 family protein n=1 Tax=Methylosinus sp. Sm6 TaxID=2866948 RepID=UPI001C997C26|nr:GPW/gp25 family protein [Methylosinus sp. Sm6]MBY6239808.1 GPW/gp25 family protein [Methylosinus sp. Sm6]
MTSIGIDRHTGQPLTGWAHVVQCLQVIFSTGVGARVMRRTFGSAVPALLGQNLVPATVLRFMTAYAIAIDLWEPRFRVRSFSLPSDKNNAETAGQGRLTIQIHGDYMPNALEGDFTVVVPKTVDL